MRKSNRVLLSVLGLILVSTPAWAWFNEGHEIVAVIAADDLTPAARSHVAQILGVPDDTRSAENAMATASIRPDTEFREKDKATALWHFIDTCLQDRETDLPAANSLRLGTGWRHCSIRSGGPPTRRVESPLCRSDSSDPSDPKHPADWARRGERLQ